VGRRPGDAAIPTPGREDNITGGYTPPQLMGPMFMTRIVDREGEHEQAGPSNATNEELNRNTPDLLPATDRESDTQSQGGYEYQETVTQNPPEAPSEHVSEGDHVGEDAQGTIQPERIGRCWRPWKHSSSY
jgi:hypothetical protein